MRKIFFLILIASLLLLSSCGTEKFTYCELRLPLGSEFRSEESDGFDATYTDGDATVFVTRISFEAAFADGIPDTYSPLAFARFYQLNNSHEGLEIDTSSHVPRYSYTGSDGEATLFMMHTFYRTPYAYFVVTYSCDEGLMTEYEDDFIRCADGAKIIDYNG